MCDINSWDLRIVIRTQRKITKNCYEHVCVLQLIKRRIIIIIIIIVVITIIIISSIIIIIGRFSGLMVRVPGNRYRGPVSIPGATKFSEKQCVWNVVHSASWIQLKSYLKEKVAAPV
jgi:hypothetical protein